MDYQEFYDKLLDYIKQDPWLKSEMDRIAEHYFNWTENGRIDHEPIQGMEIHGWNLIHSTVINLHSEDKHQHIFDIVKQFVRSEYPMDDKLFDDLMTFQSHYLIDYKKIKEYPKILKFDFDIPGYLQDQCDLNSSAIYEFDFPEDKDQSLQRFCEQIFFARRRNFGKAWLTKK